MKAIAILILALLPSAVFADTYRETRYLKMSAAGIQILLVHCGAGKLIISGVAGADAIHVTAKIESKGNSKGEFKLLADKAIELDLKRDYNQALLFSNVVAPLLTNLAGRIHLNIKMPAKMNLKIIDGSGAIQVSNMIGNLEITDNSGAIKAASITGHILIVDGSGDIEIEDVTGAIEINDGSGEIVIQDVTGNVKIKDASGGIEIHDIGGSVTVSDGSGLIDIYKVQKNVLIHEAGTGKLLVDGVGGKVIIREYREVEIENNEY